MSLLAKKPIVLPSGVSLLKQADSYVMRGPKGEEKVLVLSGVKVDIEGDNVSVALEDDNLQSRANVGTQWSLLKNASIGVKDGYIKKLDIQGVGYRAQMEGSDLVLHLGFVNPVRFPVPEGIFISVEKNIISVSGISKEKVGSTAAKIRANKKPEPYKGKGIRYEGEVVHLKPGKKAATTK